MVGGVLSETVTTKLHVAELPDASVIFHVTVVDPLLKLILFSVLAITLVADVAPAASR